MNILAIEASSDACSCALKTDSTLHERYELAPRQHTRLLLPMVQSLLQSHDMALAEVDCIAFGSGPGSFTGVRIAACMAQGLALAAGKPVAPVSSLAALALRGGGPGDHVLACLDARMGEVYLGAFRLALSGGVEALTTEQLGAPNAVDIPESESWLCVGSGWAAFEPVLVPRFGKSSLRRIPDLHPGAAQVAILAEASGAAMPAAQAIPSYLRREVTTPRKRSAVPESVSR